MAFIRSLCFVLLVGLAAACQPRCPKCPPMWIFYKGNCYRFFGTGKTYDEAEKYCQQFTQVGQGHVASIASAEENNLLLTMWKSASEPQKTGALWIGCTDKAGEKNFIWTDGSPVGFTAWSDGRPKYNSISRPCAHMRYKYAKWNDAKCDNVWPHICKMATTD
ncbi:alpha-N-acetylgalactosamine-specific lectin-like [Patiria miniata]|uniref:C-type lectin domain-containing protein n=1 Tax=Patiria miniata TaxID=46514 RepID=A0A914AP14_PATMI|nr:alpha-N-acetylgalactosamine-specific lectin-like [Patiria miniata]